MSIDTLDATQVQPAADVWAVDGPEAAPALRPGWRYFPITARAKTPAFEGDWRAHATTDARKIEAWRALGLNLAVHLEAAGVAVIDIDGPDGEAAWAQLCEGRDLPATYEVSTPRGGRHLYFVGQLRPSVSKLTRKVDTRGLGSYVLVPGSRTDAGAYEVLSDAPLATLPAWIPAALEAASPRHKEAAAVRDLDLAVNVRRGITFLERQTPLVLGEGADERLYEIACELREYGISGDRSIDLITEHLSFDPWEDGRTDAFIARKVANAWEYGQNEPGAWGVGDLAQTFAGALAGLVVDDDEELTWEGLGDLLASEPQPVAELVPNLIEKGIFQTLAGVGGTNKSRLGLQWGLCIGTGTTIMGRAVERATFVFLSCEDGRDEIVRRAHAITKRLRIPGDAPVNAVRYFDRRGKRSPLIIVRDVEDDDPIDITAFGQKFVTALRAMPGHKFVLIDSTYNAARFLGKAKISEAAVQECINWFDALCAAANCTILSLWHPSQAGSEREDGAGWSVAWHNTPRGRLYISPVKDRDDVFELSCKKRNHGRRWPPITLHWSEGALLPKTDVAEVDMQARFHEACIDVAIMAAGQGSPIRKIGSLNKWMLDDIEVAAGYRPTERAVKEALAAGLRSVRLRYFTSKKGGAGYYPFDAENLERLAMEAAGRREEAKRRREGQLDELSLKVQLREV